MSFVFRLLQQDEDGEFSSSSSAEAFPTTAEGLSVDVSFEDILMTIIFLMASWMMAIASQSIGLPSLVGEIITGFILGPPLLDLVPYPEAMVLIGSFGLIGLLLDSGINLDIARLRETGTRAVLMAVTGTILALGVGLAMGYAESGGVFRSSFAVGAAFAPSSFGVASQVLAKGEILNTPMGQVIVAASVVDDILGLILLSIMEVLVKESPRILDYVLPFLSSFGYLIILGYLGITVVPHLVEHYIQPRFPPETRDFVGFSMLWILVALYLPLMNYSRASYLTGAFLAGLSFSQVHSVHTQYTRAGPHLKIWLMRIFFAANIGFQVPIKYFTDGEVLNWGFLYFIPVLSKIPLGLLVPRTSRDLPDDFPYDPYWRDAIITTLAFTCRAEFNFIVASFALSAGVFDPEQYAAVVFAILLSAIVTPLALSKIIEYYNGKLRTFLEGKHEIDRIENTRDGTRPLFWAIQARTPVSWGLQEKFTQALESVGLMIVDHRSWHTLGLQAVNITEIFCQDKIANIRIRGAFQRKESLNNFAMVSNSKHLDDSPLGQRTVATIKESPSREYLAELEDMEEGEEDCTEQTEIELRKQIVRDALVDCLGPDVDDSSYTIIVSKWETVVFDGSNSSSEENRMEEVGRSRSAGYRLAAQASSIKAPSVKESSLTDERNLPTPDEVLQLPDLEAPTSLGGESHLATDLRSLAPLSLHCRRVSASAYSDLACSLTDDSPDETTDLWEANNASFIGQSYFMASVDPPSTGGPQILLEARTIRPQHGRRPSLTNPAVSAATTTATTTTTPPHRTHRRANSVDTFIPS